MLRSRFLSSSSSVASSSIVATVASSSALLQQQKRNIVFFSQQVEALENAAKYKGYTSNVWVETDDLYYLRTISKLKNPTNSTNRFEAPSTSENAIEFRGLRRIELYNADQVANKPQEWTASEPERHSSLRTNSAYGERFQRDLTSIAKKFGFKSKWWLSGREVQKRGLKLSLRMNRPNPILIYGTVNCYNADQFQDAKRVAQEPVWAISKKFMGRDFANILLPIVQERDYPTGLFVTAKQLEHFGLTHLIKAGEQPFEMTLPGRPVAQDNMKSPRRNLYNITMVKDYENIAKELGRFPVNHPTYFVSGKALARDIKKMTAEAAATTDTANVNEGEDSFAHYWITEQDLKARNWTLSDPKYTGVVMEPSSYKNGNSPFNVYSVHQLTDPDALFKIAGTQVFDKSQSKSQKYQQKQQE